MCCAYSRSKYTSKGTSSWKLFARKPEPQEVPFTSNSCAAQSQQKWVLVSQAVVSTRTSHVNFLFSERRLNTVLENNLIVVKNS
ncbi:uncharacterized protein LOC113965585 isoform X3 [Neopelma chrysocephalum]|uniref:uncharacterized protein LOC113965585 isoform X3 n=1 Tax=Neopelma chrysocephalum TaxID=114329 RepID=UPI000FCD0E96|nr:uncharacterized protein LOC113965585 isoform X3 [Neopelma chrysocephalum]